MSTTLLDTYQEVVTPEGVALHLRAAGPLPRALAWMLDFIVRVCIVLVGLLVFVLIGSVTGGFGFGMILIFIFIMQWLYFIVLEALWGGRTLGKYALNLRVISNNGAPAGWAAITVRNLLRVVDILPFGYALGLVMSLTDKHGRRIGDIAAGTLVVHTLPRVPSVDKSEAPPIPPTVPLQPEEQMAVIQFSERARWLSQERREELAGIVQPLTQTRRAQGVQRLHEIANWLLGRQ